MHLETNSTTASWNTDHGGQDCVVPVGIGPEDWLNAWNYIHCHDGYHYLCETMAHSLYCIAGI